MLADNAAFPRQSYLICRQRPRRCCPDYEIYKGIVSTAIGLEGIACDRKQFPVARAARL